MKSLITKLFFLLLLFGQSVSAFEVQGFVYDNSGDPLPDALVKVIDKQRNVLGRDYTDRHGFYTIKNLPDGTFDVQVQKSGLKPYIQEITFIQVQTRDLHFNYSDIYFSNKVTHADLSEFYMPLTYQVSPGVLKNIRKGEEAIQKGKFDKAIKRFEKAIDSDPEFSRSYCGLASAYLKSGNTEKAIEYYLKAIELNPLDPEPNSLLGSHYMATDDFPNAVKYLEMAVERDARLPDNQFLLGEAYYLQENYEDAEQALVRGILINPRVEDRIRLMLGNIYMNLGRLTDARDQLSRYVRNNPYARDVDIIKARIRELDARSKLYNMPDMK